MRAYVCMCVCVCTCVCVFACVCVYMCVSELPASKASPRLASDLTLPATSFHSQALAPVATPDIRHSPVGQSWPALPPDCWMPPPLMRCRSGRPCPASYSASSPRLHVLFAKATHFSTTPKATERRNERTNEQASDRPTRWPFLLDCRGVKPGV